MATGNYGIATCEEAIKKYDQFRLKPKFDNNRLNIKCVIFDGNKYAVSEYGKIMITERSINPDTGEITPAEYVNGRYIFKVDENKISDYNKNKAVKYDDITNCLLIIDEPVPEPTDDSSSYSPVVPPTPVQEKTIIQYKAPAKLKDDDITVYPSGGAISQVRLFIWLEDNNKQVTHTFNDTTLIGTIEISPKISEIPDYAFTRYAGIIGNDQWIYYAIAGTNITEIWLPDTIKTIGNYAFAENLDLLLVHYFGESSDPNNVENIKNKAFFNCNNLIKFEFGKKIKSIGSECFKGCASLTEVLWNCIGGSNVTESGNNITVNNKGWEVGNTPFYQYGSFDLRSLITTFTFGDSVKIIPDFICRDMYNLQNSVNNVSKLIIPSSVIGIGQEAFNLCKSIRNVEFKPSGNISRGIYFKIDAFKSMDILEGVIIPTLQEWCNSTFVTQDSNPLFWMHDWFYYYRNTTEYLKALGILEIPEGVSSIPANAFHVHYQRICQTSSYPKRSINPIEYAFLSEPHPYPQIYSITIPSTCNNIGNYAFGDWHWTEYVRNYAITPQKINNTVFYRLWAYPGLDLTDLKATKATLVIPKTASSTNYTNKNWNIHFNIFNWTS